ncbi:hypothetical protein C4K04_2990 [Pseudomonas chlororaphis]|uniref:DUF3757 domain-containing protein n=1 Tax=Pseudomonas chlororaphis TaxID=587753 RepID=A0A3G7TQG8_9PSED|nr:hypothetical protein [Pseudomonas chlororaphis]AZE48662.1 hypothetical protein C4K04_2990 [Pseudomonas chlororaphis]
MKILRACLLPLVSTLGLAAFSSHALADVYLCTADPCTKWELSPLSKQKREIKSTDGNNTTIEEALKNSANASITNGYNSIANTVLYLKESLWHLDPKSDPFKGQQHLTVYIYKTTDLNTRLWSCHAYSFKDQNGKKYYATCE